MIADKISLHRLVDETLANYSRHAPFSPEVHDYIVEETTNYLWGKGVTSEELAQRYVEALADFIAIASDENISPEEAVRMFFYPGRGIQLKLF